jgi:hypothetical protein
MGQPAIFRSEGCGREHRYEFPCEITSRLGSLQKPIKSLFEPSLVRVIFAMIWQNYLLMFKSLKAIFQHRSIGFLENVVSYMNVVIWIDAKNILIEGSMMDFTKRKSVLNDWISDIFLSVQGKE